MKTVISVKNLSVSYNGIEAINNINLEIHEGEFLSIIGPNGAGKTTLLNSILGFLKSDCGEIRIFDEIIKKNRKLIGYVPQTAAIDRNFPITVFETVQTAFLKSGLNPLKVFSRGENATAMEKLRLLGIEHLCKKQIKELSGGEFQKLLIARALARDPKILLLDEPISNIDNTSRVNIYSILRELSMSGITVVMVTHDLQTLSGVFDRTVCINKTVIYDGPPTDDMYRDIYGVVSFNNFGEDKNA